MTTHARIPFRSVCTCIFAAITNNGRVGRIYYCCARCRTHKLVQQRWKAYLASMKRCNRSSDSQKAPQRGLTSRFMLLCGPRPGKTRRACAPSARHAGMPTLRPVSYNRAKNYRSLTPAPPPPQSSATHTPGAHIHTSVAIWDKHIVASQNWAAPHSAYMNNMSDKKQQRQPLPPEEGLRIFSTCK